MKLLAWIAVSLSWISYVQASDLDYAPPSFDTDDGRVVFADFFSGTYWINYHISSRTVEVQSVVTFDIVEKGMPVLDLEVEPTSAMLLFEEGGEEEVSLVWQDSPDGRTRFRRLDRELDPGRYGILVTHGLTELVAWGNGTVRSAFWMSDLQGYGPSTFLESYVLTNLEYDHFQIGMFVNVHGATEPHRLVTNGSTALGENGWGNGEDSWSVEFPEYFTSSSVFFHLMPESEYDYHEETLTSIDGREIPLLVYKSSDESRVDIDDFAETARDGFAELENEWGAWPHYSLTIYGVGPGNGGMEYCGATWTSLWALRHELTHSYYARGVMPASGRDGWIDEAIASWRDDHYPQDRYSAARARLAQAGEYHRFTDRDAYSIGADLIAHLHYLFLEKDRNYGMVEFLRDLHSEKTGTSIDSEEFKQRIETAYGSSVDHLFDRTVYGVRTRSVTRDSQAESIHRDHDERPRQENPYHPILSREELMQLL